MMLQKFKVVICSVKILESNMVVIGEFQSIHYKMRQKINSHAGKSCGKISGQSLFIKVRNLCVHVTPLIQFALTGLLYVET